MPPEANDRRIIGRSRLDPYQVDPYQTQFTIIPNLFGNDTNPGPLNPPILGDFERLGSPRIGGWGAVRHLYDSLKYLVSDPDRYQIAMPLLIAVLPKFTAEVKAALLSADRPDLAAQLDRATIDHCTHEPGDELAYIYLFGPAQFGPNRAIRSQPWSCCRDAGVLPRAGL